MLKVSDDKAIKNKFENMGNHKSIFCRFIFVPQTAILF